MTYTNITGVGAISDAIVSKTTVCIVYCVEHNILPPWSSATCWAWSGQKAVMATGRLPCQQSLPHHPLSPGQPATLFQPFFHPNTPSPSSLICALTLSQLQSGRVESSSWFELARRWAQTATQLPILLLTLLFRVESSFIYLN